MVIIKRTLNNSFITPGLKNVQIVLGFPFLFYQEINRCMLITLTCNFIQLIYSSSNYRSPVLYQACPGISRRKQGQTGSSLFRDSYYIIPKYCCKHYVELELLWHILFSLFHRWKSDLSKVTKLGTGKITLETKFYWVPF